MGPANNLLYWLKNTLPRRGNLKIIPLQRYDWFMALALAVLLIAAGSARMVVGVGGIYLTFRTLLRSSEAILAEPPEETGGQAIHRLFHVL